MKLKTLLCAAALIGMMANANAASLSLVYTGGATGGADGSVVTVGNGDVLTFDLVMDFSDEMTLGGGYDVIWDSGIFDSAVWTSADLGEDDFRRDPDSTPNGLINGAFAAFNGLSGPALVGSIEFAIIGNPMAGDYNVTPRGTNGSGGQFISAVDNISVIIPDYNGVTIRVIPVPAAVWFMLSGLGALIGFGRRKVA